jgi:hypothetical protein
MKAHDYFRSFYLRLWPRKSKPDLTKYYKSVHELPIYYWFELNKTGDLKNLLVNPSDDLTNGVISAYYFIKNEYFELFGTPAEYEKHLSSMKYYGLMMAKYLESGGERSLLTHIQITKMNLDKSEDGEPFDYSKMWAAVISKMATVPDIKKMSTFDFMSVYTSLSHG